MFRSGLVTACAFLNMDWSSLELSASGLKPYPKARIKAPTSALPVEHDARFMPGYCISHSSIKCTVGVFESHVSSGLCGPIPAALMLIPQMGQAIIDNTIALNIYCTKFSANI